LGRQAVKIIADTNLLIRVIIEDDPRQAKAAQAALEAADTVAIGVTALCELAWLMTQRYRLPERDVAEAIRMLLSSANVVIDQPVVEAGLAMLDSGGDFADGVIAFEGHRLGGETFVSFDREAVSVLKAGGFAARSP
jgi:predicted nucleic-acid-binding protein